MLSFVLALQEVKHEMPGPIGVVVQDPSILS